jgi:hypothetical protein
MKKKMWWLVQDKEEAEWRVLSADDERVDVDEADCALEDFEDRGK